MHTARSMGGLAQPSTRSNSFEDPSSRGYVAILDSSPCCVKRKSLLFVFFIFFYLNHQQKTSVEKQKSDLHQKKIYATCAQKQIKKRVTLISTIELRVPPPCWGHCLEACVCFGGGGGKRAGHLFEPYPRRGQFYTGLVPNSLLSLGGIL